MYIIRKVTNSKVTSKLKLRLHWGVRIAALWLVTLLAYYLASHHRWRALTSSTVTYTEAEASPEPPAVHKSLHQLEGVEIRPNLLTLPQIINPYIAICTIAKDELDMREWLQYHYFAGIEKFYVYDHNSSVPLWRELEDWIRIGVVEYMVFSGHHNITEPRDFTKSAQGYMYADCLSKAKAKHYWAAFIDPDEYIVLYNQDKVNIPQFMRQYERYGGLGINWLVFGSAGYDTRPEEGVLASYDKCLPAGHEENGHIKSVVNVKRVVGLGTTPHEFEYEEGFFAVNEVGRMISSSWSRPPSHTKVALHHYTLKSLEDFQAKMKRGGGSGGEKTMQLFEGINAQATAVCNRGKEVYAMCCAPFEDEDGDAPNGEQEGESSSEEASGEESGESNPATGPSEQDEGDADSDGAEGGAESPAEAATASPDSP